MEKNFHWIPWIRWIWKITEAWIGVNLKIMFVSCDLVVEWQDVGLPHRRSANWILLIAEFFCHWIIQWKLFRENSSLFLHFTHQTVSCPLKPKWLNMMFWCRLFRQSDKIVLSNKICYGLIFLWYKEFFTRFTRFVHTYMARCAPYFK